MVKFLYLITLSCLLVGTSLGHPGHGQPWYYSFFHFFTTPSTVCTNSTTQAAYLTKTVALISTLQSNSTYNAVLQTQSPNLIAYIQSPVNQALLYSNCSAFVTGIKKAKSADQIVRIKLQLIAGDIDQRFRQVPRDVTGSNGANDMD